MRPGAYPHPVASVQLLETPLSWILQAGDRVYKLKRPVRLPFVDQSLPAHRQHLCHEELRLNRRFAPDVYLEVCAVCAQDGQARIGGAGRPIEYAVVMRAFDRREQLDQLVLHKRLAPAELEEFATWLATMHQQLPSQSGSFGPGQPEAVAAAMARNSAECAAASDIFGTTLRCRQLAERLAEEIRSRAVALRWRAGARCIHECHADLHLSNVVRLDGRLRPFDCLEFDPALRWIDAAQDIAFLHADLLGYDEPVLAAAFVDAYLRSSGDYHACLVLPLYTADRAMVRAKVLALQASALREGGDRELLRRRHSGYLDVAEHALQRRTARCVALTGLPGSGKSWLAARLAPPLHAVVVSSDVERKRLGRLGALDCRCRGAGLYSPQSTEQVYERLGDCAASVLGGGFDVIVDANFGKRAQRSALAELCRLLAVPVTVIECEAPGNVLQQRIQARLGAANDPSDADLRVLDLQRAGREALTPEEGLRRVTVDTTRDDVVERALEAVIGAAGGQRRGMQASTGRESA